MRGDSEAAWQARRLPEEARDFDSLKAVSLCAHINLQCIFGKLDWNKQYATPACLWHFLKFVMYLYFTSASSSSF